MKNNTMIPYNPKKDLETNYYNKTEVELLVAGGGGGSIDLSNYYKKLETYSKAQVDALVAGGGADLSDYYTKAEVDDLISAIPETDLSNYYNKTQVDSLIPNISTKQDTLVSATNIKTINGESILGSGDLVISGGGSGGNVDLSNYYKKTETYSKVEVDTKIADIPTTDLSGYYNKTQTETLLSNKINKGVGVVGATKTKVTYNNDGIITGGADLVEADLPNISQSKITNLVSDLSNKQSRLISGTNIKTINGQSVLGSGDIVITGGGNMTPEQVNDLTILKKQLLDGSQNGDFSGSDLSSIDDTYWVGSPSKLMTPCTNSYLLDVGCVNWLKIPANTTPITFNELDKYVYYGGEIITGKYVQICYYVYSQDGINYGNNASVITATGINSGNGSASSITVSYEQVAPNLRLYTKNAKVTQANAVSVCVGNAFGTVPTDIYFAFPTILLSATATTTRILPCRKSLLDKAYALSVHNSSNWKGKKVLWLGTSIPDYGLYPEIISKRLGFTLTNEALGASMIRKNDIRSLSMTQEEYQAEYITSGKYSYTQAEVDAFKLNSYEKKIMQNLGQDLYIFDFGWNDYSRSSTDFTTLPSADSLDRTTFVGAFNFCITELLKVEPKARIMIVAHYEKEQRPLMVAAQEYIANHWKFPICKVYEKTGWTQIINPATGKTILNDWLPDSLHPHTDTSGKSSALLARILEEFINGI